MTLTAAVSQPKEALQAFGDCNVLVAFHKDPGLIYCHSRNLKDARTELLTSEKLAPGNPDVSKALKMLDTLNQ